jgi:putative aldouronate transport system substrate-binding protein
MFSKHVLIGVTGQYFSGVHFLMHVEDKLYIVACWPFGYHKVVGAHRHIRLFGKYKEGFMKKLKNAISVILCIFVVTLAILPVSAIRAVPVTKIDLNQANVTINLGSTFNLKVTYTPADTTQKLLKYSTSNARIATIDVNGTIKGVAEGTAIIVVTSTANNNATAKCTVTVVDNRPNKLPLTKKKVTLTAWAQFRNINPKTGVKTFNDVLAYQELEKRTGVHIEWTHPANGQEKDSFNLMIAAGYYPDIIYDYNYYTGGLDKAVSDGVYIKLNDLIAQYAPNYQKVRTKNGDVRRGTMTDSGSLVAFYSINTPIQGPWMGMAVRKDWLDDLGLKLPVTYDDWYTMLKAFKEKKDASAPLWINNRGSDMFGILPSGYGVTALGSTIAGSFIMVNGNVKYSPLENGYKEYITMLAKWYKDGLIDRDYFTRKDSLVPSSLADTGKSGAFADVYTLMAAHKLTSQDKKINVVAVPNPVKTAGDKLHIRQYNFEVGNNKACITTACKDPVLAAKWLDYMYSDEGSLLCMYGVEGQTYNMADGKPVPSDLIVKNPEGLSMGDARNKYTAWQPCQYFWERELAGLDQGGLDAINKIWPSNSDGSYMMPAVTLTIDEGNKFSKIMNDVDTYALEMSTKFIIGAEPLSKYDEFINRIKDMGIAQAIRIQQTALNRYHTRSK